MFDIILATANPTSVVRLGGYVKIMIINFLIRVYLNLCALLVINGQINFTIEDYHTRFSIVLYYLIV